VVVVVQAATLHQTQLGVAAGAEAEQVPEVVVHLVGQQHREAKTVARQTQQTTVLEAEITQQAVGLVTPLAVGVGLVLKELMFPLTKMVVVVVETV
jgi:hypothetical protein